MAIKHISIFLVLTITNASHTMNETDIIEHSRILSAVLSNCFATNNLAECQRCCKDGIIRLQGDETIKQHAIDNCQISCRFAHYPTSQAQSGAQTPRTPAPSTQSSLPQTPSNSLRTPRGRCWDT